MSTLDQNEPRQLEGVELDKVFLDKASGKDVKRPQLTAMLEFVREGDSVFCHSMDRVGRNLGDLRNLVDVMTDRGISVHFLKGGPDVYWRRCTDGEPDAECHGRGRSV